jgi:hypothetical protein
MNLHNKYYCLREEVWKELENCVHSGPDIIGEFPIVIGELNLDGNSKRSGKFINDCTTIVIFNIIKDENYQIHPNKESENDINVTTNKISVIIHSLSGVSCIIEVEPDILDLQELSTYLSGGFSAYEN